MQDLKMRYSLVALTGKAGSGKTTVANYLLKHGFKYKYSFADGVKEVARKYFGMKKKDRRLLQQIGTEHFRTIDKDVWIKYVWSDVALNILCGDALVIDDLRFSNEAKACREAGFVLIKLERPDYTDWEAEGHASETVLEQIRTDFVVSATNVEDLLSQIREIVFE